MIRKHFLTYLALTAIAVAQPVLDLYGKNLTVFSAAKLSSAEVAAFLVLLLLGPAAAATAVDAVTRVFGPRVNEAVRLVQLGFFSGLLGLAATRLLHLENDAVSVAAAVLLGLWVPWAFDTSRTAREWSRWLSVSALLIGGTAFVQVKPLILTDSGRSAGASVATPTDVFLVVLDEFPLYALLDSEGRINEERYPGLAELAAGSTWYRNNIAVSNFTHQAVPAILSSKLPTKDGGPFMYSYPRNIFTLYRDVMNIQGREPVTSLCPPAECGGLSEVSDGFSASRFRTFLKDAAVVYGQRVLPPTLRKRLPAVDQGWGGFAAVRDRFLAETRADAFGEQDAAIDAATAFVGTKEKTVSVVHALMPHAPWRLTPDARVAPLSPEIGTQNPEDDDGTRDTYQTFLHQVAATDSAVQHVIRTLKDAGRWDTTMVVLTADHGISFLPTMPQRHTDFSDMGQAADVYRVPTFIKYPGQKEAAVSDCLTSNLDILPTINEVLGTKSSWEFDGKSLVGGCPGRTRLVVHSVTVERGVFSDGFAAARDRAAYYASIVPNDGPATGIAAVGNSRSLIGSPISSSIGAAGVESWTLKQATMFDGIRTTKGSPVPATVTGVVRLSGTAGDGTEGIIAVDGVAAGVIGELSGQEGDVPFTAVLDYSLLTAGSHTVELFIRAADGTVSRAGEPR